MLKRREGIVTADMNGETVMMDVMSGKYYNLGSVGGRIWDMLQAPMSREQLVAALIREYDVSSEQCSRDIAPFLEKMTTIGLILEQ